MPDETKGLPDNDPLPAGALVFERWRRGKDDSIVRIFYVAQGLKEARNCRYPDARCPGFRIPLRELSLKDFTELASRADDRFICGCKGDKVDCSKK